MKAAFTRAYNKTSAPTPYAAVSVKKGRGEVEYTDSLPDEEEDSQEPEDEQDDDVNVDSMIVVICILFLLYIWQSYQFVFRNVTTLDLGMSPVCVAKPCNMYCHIWGNKEQIADCIPFSVKFETNCVIVANWVFLIIYYFGPVQKLFNLIEIKSILLDRKLKIWDGLAHLYGAFNHQPIHSLPLIN